MFPADRIRQLRKDSGMTQSQLALRLGIDRTTLTKYETGERKPDISAMYSIADFFKVSIEYLTGRSNQPNGMLPSIALEDILDPSYAARVTLCGYKLLPEDKQRIKETIIQLLQEFNN